MDINKLEDILLKVEKPARYTGGELNSVVKNLEGVNIRYAFAFPDVYEVGMSHLGMHILYNLLNKINDVWCERVFAPWTDLEGQLRENNIELFALESMDSLKDFDILGFTLQYEMSYTNILNMLDMANIPIESAKRDNSFPLVIAGGPCAFNPEPLHEFVDMFFLGESEELLVEVMDLYREHKKNGYDKNEFLKEACLFEGIYVPEFYDVEYNEDGTISKRKKLYDKAPDIVKKRIIKDLDKSFFPEKIVVPFIETVHDRIMLEIFRGCTRGCRFCQAGMIYRPIREKSVETLLKQADLLIESTGHEEISLSSLSTGDYSKLIELATGLLDKYEDRRIGLSLPSLRLDSISFDLMERVQKVRKSGLTFAPEAGSQRMRDIINKNITEDDILGTVKTAFDLGWSTVKLYFMVGLPGETIEDIYGIKDLAYDVKNEFFNRERENIRGNLRVNVSAACFVPKPFTPFQWEAQNTVDEFFDKTGLLKKAIKDKKVSYSYHDPKLSSIEGVFALGDRRIAKVLKTAWKKGCIFDGWGDKFNYDVWIEAFIESGVDPEFYNQRQKNFEEILPWDFIDCGVTKEYLIKEKKKSLEGTTTEDCRLNCTGCGVNMNLVGGPCFEDSI